MTDAQKIKLQRWWMEQLRTITRKVMAEEEKRKDRLRTKNESMLGEFGIDSLEDIDELYGYGAISSKKRDKLVELFEKVSQPDEMYQAKIDLLQDAYTEAQRIMRDLGQEV